MEEGREEFRKQTDYWQHLYDEQTEDLFEMHEKIIQLENQIEFYVENPEFLQSNVGGSGAGGEVKFGFKR